MAWSRVEGEGEEENAIDDGDGDSEGGEDESEDGGGGGGGEEAGGEEEGGGGGRCPSLYLLADCPSTNALYVAFRGTKAQGDLLVLADVAPLSPPWPAEKGRLSPAGAVSSSPSPPLPPPSSS